MAAIKVECVPKATCNPPPPFKYACPENVSLEKPITIATYDGTSCFVEFEVRGQGHPCELQPLQLRAHGIHDKSRHRRQDRGARHVAGHGDQ